MTTIKENLSAAIAAVEAYPEERIKLHHYSEDTPCGTLYCTAGLLATLPFFVDQLGKQEWLDDPLMVASEMAENEAMFGSGSFNALFTHRNWGSLDGTWDTTAMSDKDLALARLRRWLEEYK